MRRVAKRAAASASKKKGNKKCTIRLTPYPQHCCGKMKSVVVGRDARADATWISIRRVAKRAAASAAKEKTQQVIDDDKFTPTKHLRVNTFEWVDARTKATWIFDSACREKSRGIGCNTKNTTGERC